MNTTLKVDILFPCFNSAGTIYQALRSIQQQTHANIRVVMIDNNSSDDSVDIFNSFRDERFECIRHDKTVPLGDNFNRCLQHVEADYYCIMHADDEYQQDYIEVMLDAIYRSPNAAFAWCNANIINEDSKKIFSLKNLIKKRTSPSHNTEYSGCDGLTWISEYNKIVAPTVMYRKEVIDNVGKYNPTLKFTLDWEYYFRALKSGSSILHVNRVLFNYRIHTKQQTAALIASMEKYYEMHSLLNNIHDYISKTCKSVNTNKYRYFRYTILADIFSDLVSMQLSSAARKFRFFVRLFGSMPDERGL